MIPVRLLRVRVLAAATAILLLFTLLALYLSRTRGYDLLDDHPLDTGISLHGHCSEVLLGALDDVQVVLKVGAAEAHSKLPLYLGGTVACVPHLHIFSDYEERVYGHLLHDALARLPPEDRVDNPDFQIYEEIQRLKKDNATIEKTSEGWRLDKYKFLPMMELTWAMTPDKPWYFFIELDTYVNWENLVRFLQRLDPSQPLYIGSPVWPQDRPIFAHGGSGFILSREALRRLAVRGREFREGDRYPVGSHQFGIPIAEQCCGDEILAWALKDSGVTINGYWPMFNGEKPSTMRFNQEQWCEAIITMHHMNHQDFSKMRSWELKRPDPHKPLTFAELYGFLEPYLYSKTRHWDNMSEDVEYLSPDAAATSVDTCAVKCQNDRLCMQYAYRNGTCRLSHTIRLGHRQKLFDDVPVISGWQMDRILVFKARNPCQHAHLVHPNP
jgi:hypothetical protein